MLVSSVLLKSVMISDSGGRDTEGTLTATTQHHVSAGVVDLDSAAISEVLQVGQLDVVPARPDGRLWVCG